MNVNNDKCTMNVNDRNVTLTASAPFLVVIIITSVYIAQYLRTQPDHRRVYIIKRTLNNTTVNTNAYPGQFDIIIIQTMIY